MNKVAIISHSPAFAGAERMLFNMALILKSTQFYEPIVFIPNSSIKSLSDACEENNIHTVTMNLYSQYIFVSEHNKNYISEQTLECIDQFVDLISRYDIDIIIVNTATSVVPALAAIRLQIPVIGWIHGILDSYLIDPIYDSNRRLFFDRMFIAMCDNVICCSNWTSKFYKRYELTPVNILYNWAPFPKKTIDINEVDNVFVCLNTFDECKGIIVLLEACSILNETNSDFTVHLYGDGSPAMLSKITDYIKKHDLKSKVIIKDRTNNIEDVYNKCLCLVQPSFIESFGMTILEAMSYRRPVIAAKSGGPEEIIIDGETGFLIDRNRADVLADKMKLILENKNEAMKMGICGEKVFKEKFSPIKAREEIIQLIDTTIKKYDGISKTKQMYADSLIMLLKSEAQLSNNVQISNESNKVEMINYSREIPSQHMIFSGAIKNKKKYTIYSQHPDINKIGIIFTTLDNSISAGTIELRLLIDGKKLRSSVIKFNTIVNNQWTYFNFQELKNSNQKKILLELIFNYETGSNKYGVYEDNRKRSLKYKILNKLGCSDKCIDVLYTDCRK